MRRGERGGGRHGIQETAFEVNLLMIISTISTGGGGGGGVVWSP